MKKYIIYLDSFIGKKKICAGLITKETPKTFYLESDFKNNLLLNHYILRKKDFIYIVTEDYKKVREIYDKYLECLNELDTAKARYNSKIENLINE